MLIVGCGDDGGSSFFPLTVGSTWDYRMIMTITQYEPDTTSTVDTLAYSTAITEETTLSNGTEVVEQRTIVETGMGIDTMYSYMRDTGDYLLVYDSKTDTTADTAAVYPLEEGNTWTMYNDTVEVVGEESVTVPAGTWTCWHLAYGDGMDIYFAENVGMVKQIQRYTDQYYSYEAVVDLTDYDVK